ncbi:hypothetical protein CWC22_022845 [Pseudoalteromonas rubra]|uniref:Uncharacterized protein n=1 Tax=Pseudoalteromonas rubra TaxID=43658 RepID=A0A5S3V2G5_9GAMM|nr:hypothetical protein [Pseudoalteromonas rubra]QPB85841.1 hypothetical protein CWC22_022845 [Pseudoalteromonas rubra]
MKLENGSGQPPVHLQNKEQKTVQSCWQNNAGEYANGQALAVKKPGTVNQAALPEQGSFKVLLAQDTFDIHNISPKALSSFLSDITRLLSV